MEGHVALDRNLGQGYNTLYLRLIPGVLLNACPHRQFYTLSVFFRQSGCTVKLLPKCMHAKQGGSLYHFYDGLKYDPARGANLQPTA